MKKFVEKMLAAVLTAALFLPVLAGCGRTVKPEDYASTVVATLGEEKIYLDEANLYLRSDQYYYEMMYAYMYGMKDIWSMQVDARKTMADNLRESTLTVLRQIYILCSHAEEMGVSLSEADLQKVEQAVDRNLEQSDARLTEAIHMDRARMVEVFTKNALANRVWEAVVAAADTNVTDEEARCIGASYVRVTEPAPETQAAGESRTAEETQAESQAAAGTAQEIAQRIYDAVQGGSTLSEAAQAANLTSSRTTYFTGETFNEGTLGAHALALAEGETAVFEISGDAWYVMTQDTSLDRSATDSKKESMISERQAEVFRTTYTQWQESSPEFVVEDEIWKSIPLDAVFVVPETTPADEGTTAGGQETTSGGGETTSAGAETTPAEEKTTPAGEETTKETTKAG